MAFQRVFSGAPWEKKAAYCRAIRTGNLVFVAGTTGVNEQGEVVSPNGYDQTKRCFEIIESALKEVGADLSNVVRTRMFVTDISQWESYTKAHHECFSEHPPTATLLEVQSLISPDMLIEIEVDAVVED